MERFRSSVNVIDAEEEIDSTDIQHIQDSMVRLLSANVSRTLRTTNIKFARQLRYNSSVEDIAAQQHTGSRSAPKPTAETGTSTQNPTSKAQNKGPSQNELPESQQQKAPEQEDGEEGSTNYMAHNEDTAGGELKSNSPFRAAPEEKKVGAKTIAPDLEANERK